MKMPKLRRKSRTLALQILFQQNFSPDVDLQTSLKFFHQSFPFSEEVWEYAKVLIRGVQDKKTELGKLIDSTSNHWNRDRMSLIDLILIEVCLYEALFEGTPKSVAINEALEMARKFSNAESVSFINGILDRAIANGQE